MQDADNCIVNAKYFLFRYFNSLTCHHDHNGAEDAEMGKCMSNLNVSAMDTRDSKGRGRFFPFIPEQHLITGKPTKDYWYWTSIFYPVKEVKYLLIYKSVTSLNG